MITFAESSAKFVETWSTSPQSWPRSHQDGQNSRKVCLSCSRIGHRRPTQQSSGQTSIDAQKLSLPAPTSRRKRANPIQQETFKPPPPLLGLLLYRTGQVPHRSPISVLLSLLVITSSTQWSQGFCLNSWSLVLVIGNLESVWN